MPLVSVLMPCRDAAAYLPDAIDSISTQSLTDYEVIAVDDHSTDSTRALLDAWAVRDNRVHVAAATGSGIVDALRQAAAGARGSFLARMDADDRSHPHRFARQLAFLEQNPHIAACGTNVRYFPRAVVRAGSLRYEDWLNAVHTPAHVECEIFVECPIAHPTLFVRTSHFAGAGGYSDCDWPEDYDLILRLWRAGAALANVPEVLYAWRERPDRLSRTHPRYAEDAFRRCKVHHLMQSRLRGHAGVVIWGAGPVGKAFARALFQAGAGVRAFVDIDARKIGQLIYGLPVLAPQQLGRYDDAYVVAAVGSPGARAEIRRALQHLGRTEPDQFCAVA